MLFYTRKISINRSQELNEQGLKLKKIKNQLSILYIFGIINFSKLYSFEVI